MLQSMGSQRVEHNLMTKHLSSFSLIPKLNGVLPPFFFFFLKQEYTFLLCVRPSSMLAVALALYALGNSNSLIVY